MKEFVMVSKILSLWLRSLNARFIILACALLISGVPARAQWVQTNGPRNDILTFGGDITCLASIGNDLFAGTESNGLIRSTDNGTSWTLLQIVSLFSSELSVNSLLVSGGDLFTIAGGAIFLSSDTGASWKELFFAAPDFSSISAIAVSGSNLIAGTSGDSTYLSTDTGKSWTALDTLFGVNSFAVMGENLFAGNDQGVWLSTDNGAIWTLTDTLSDTLDDTVPKFVFALAVNGGNLFAETTTDSGLFLSTDDGSNWTAINNGLPDGRVYALASSGQNIYAGTWGNGVFVSTNNGSSWNATGDSGLTNSYINALLTNNGNLYAGTNGDGVFLSTDNGMDWSVHNPLTLINSQINSLNTIDGKLFACTQAGIFVTSDSGEDWSLDTAGIGNVSVIALAANDGNLFAGTPGNGIFRSTDNGTSWFPADSGLFFVFGGDSSYGAWAMNVYSLMQRNGILYAGTQGTLFISTNNGISWSNPAYTTQRMGPSYFAIIGTNIIAGNIDGLFYSPDSGEDWYPVQDLPPYTNVNAINSLVLMGGYIYAATNQSGVWLSKNGTDWLQANDSGLSDPNVITLLVNGSDLFAATNSGRIFFSSDSAATWHPVDSGLQPGLAITSLAVIDSVLYAGTSDSAIWRHSLIKPVVPPSIVAQTPAIPMGIQIYPNPAMNSITITSCAGPISILDPLGRSYEVLQTGNTLDISSLPSGVYFVSDGNSWAKFVKE